jgi:hypothetical protein
MDLESARKMAVQILGRVAHLLADMSVPAHTHNDLHFDINGKLQVTGDGYEDWMAKHYSEGFIEQPYINPIYWNALNAARQGPLVDVYQAVHTGDQSRSIRYLFYTMNQIADRFPSNDNSGDNVYSTNYNGDDYSILNIIQQITHPYNAGSVQPYDVNKYAFRYCIRAVAGLFYWFATQTGMLRVQVPIYVTKQFEFDQIESQSQSGYIAESLTISTPSVISKNNKNYTFAGWSDGNSSNPRTVTPIGSETYTAFYKVVHKSNDPAAFTNNSQRKIVRTRDNWLHMVYESMGRVWLEHSTDNGTTWFLGNNGKPLDNGEGKCPSIDWHYYQGLPNDPTFNSIIVVFQQKLSTTNTYTIEYAIFRYTNSSYIRVTPSNSVLLYTEPAGGDLYASVNANPNIAWGTGGGSTMPFVLCFERKSTAQGMQPGIYWRYGYMCEGGIINNPSPVNPVLIPGTTSNSINATVMLNKQCANNPNFDIVYEQYVSASSGSIKDAILYCRYDGTSWLPSTTQVVTLSSSTGVSNYKPSMVQMPDNNIRVCWIRSVNGQPQNSPFDVNPKLCNRKQKNGISQ